MPETVKNCPLCQSTTSALFDTRQFRGQPITNRICENCGFVFQSPRMTVAELEDFYTAEYRRVYQGNDGPSQKDLRTQKGRASALLEFMSDTTSKVNRHLDIGCSAGIFLETIRNHFGNQSLGIEPGDTYRKFAQDKGITVYTAIDDLQAADEPRFDLISLAHVLEHLPDPVGYLTELREKHLAPEGWLLLEVPNLYCHDSFEIAHLTNFSRHTLLQTLHRAGYEIVKLEAHGRPRSALLPLYLTLLAKPGEGGGTHSLRAESNVAIKRRVGMLRRRIAQKLFPQRAWVSFPEG